MNSAILLSLTLAAYAHPVAQGVDNKKDVVKSTHTIKGRFMSFGVGDYVHAFIKDGQGLERHYYIGGDGLEYFLAINHNKSATFTYQVVSSFIPEGGGRMDIDRMEWAKVGKLDSRTWWKAQLKRSTRQKLDKKYRPLVEKLTH